MSRRLWISLLIAVILFMHTGCNNSNPATPVAKEKVQDKEMTVQKPSDKHIVVPNSHLYIIPPPGFVADKLSGTIVRQDETEYSPDFLQMTIYSGMTADQYLEGIKTASEKIKPNSWKEEKLMVNGHPAKRCDYLSMKGMGQSWFYFTDGYTGEMLLANYPASDPATAEEMQEAMNTIILFKQ